MKVQLLWSKPIQLRNGSAENLIFTYDIDEIPDTAGIYVFGRRKGSSIVPVYIGQAINLWKRIKSQRNNLKLMMALKNSPNRSKFVTFAEVIGVRGQNLERALDVAERALIEHALSDGHDITNVQGAKRKKHQVHSAGKRDGRQWIPKQLTIQRR